MRPLTSVCAALVVVAVAASKLLAQAPTADNPAILHVQIAQADDGRRVAGARLVLSFVPPASEALAAEAERAESGAAAVLDRASQSGDSDAAGGADFNGLRPGRYSLSVQPPPGLGLASHSRLFDLAPGQHGSLTVSLPRAGTITGRIVSDGRPVAGLLVQVLRRSTRPGASQVLTATRGGVSTRLVSPPTGTDGRFGIAGLTPGEYYVVASARPRGPGARGPEYPPTYYPSATEASRAMPVVVRAGEEANNIEIVVRRVKPGRLRVKVVDSSGHSAASDPLGDVRTTVSLRAVADEQWAVPVYSTLRRSPGSDWNEMADIPPGDYYAIARIMSSEDPGTGQRPLAWASDGRRFWEKETGYEAVSVKEDSEASVTVRTNSGASIAGRVVIDESSGGAAETGKSVGVVVAATPDVTERSPVATMMRSVVAHDGAFVLTGVRGYARLNAQGDGVMKSVTRAGQDITGQTLEFKGREVIKDIVITMSRATANLEGTVRNFRPEGCAVVVFPEDRSTWRSNGSHVRVLRPIPSMPATAPAGMQTSSADRAPAATTDNRAPFVSSPLLPGRYLVVAVDDDGGAATDTNALERLAAVATRVTLTAGQTTAIELQVGPDRR